MKLKVKPEQISFQRYNYVILIQVDVYLGSFKVGLVEECQLFRHKVD